MIIDAHQHFWKRGLFDTRWLETPRHEPICRDFLPADLEPLLKTAGVDYSVFVQTQHDTEENLWALREADLYPFIAGVVGWIDLSSPLCEDQLVEFRNFPKFVGVRHITQDEPDDDFIIRPDVIRGLHVLQKHRVPFDLLFYVKHLRHAATLAKELPELPMVIDHLAKPEIRAQRTDNWETNFRAAAKFPNVCCKLSGMVTEADWEGWTPEDLQVYVDVALDAFGPERLMYGSDWPVSELAGDYQDVFNALRDCLTRLSDSERDAIYCQTAKRFYGLTV